MSFICNGDGISECSLDMECVNFSICKNKRSLDELETNHGICNSCYFKFGENGRLTYIILEECPICFENDVQGIQMPKCIHGICISCFKRCFCYIHDETNEPKFPYEHNYLEFLQNPDDIKWEKDDSIREYMYNWKRWNVNRLYHKSLERYLQKCCLCRK